MSEPTATKTLAEMTPDDLNRMIDERVEQKLQELLGDPDAGLELTPAMRERLEAQRREVAEGARGRSVTQVWDELKLGTTR
jgi:hypothetical protein